MPFSQLPDEPTAQDWDRWVEKHSKINGADEENLLRMAEPDGQCASCHWWQSRNLAKDLLVLENGDVYIGGGLAGECWRFPPNGDPAAQGEITATYPTTTSNMTCGEWKARTCGGRLTRLTETIHIGVATERARNGETVRTYQGGSVVPRQQYPYPPR